MSEPLECPDCEGKGIITDRYEDCFDPGRWEGYYQRDLPDIECDTCRGSGKTHCGYCDRDYAVIEVAGEPCCAECAAKIHENREE